MEKTTTKKKATTKQKNPEYKKMQAEIEMLKKSIEAMVSNNSVRANSQPSSFEEEVLFISLYDGKLNLCTEKHGNGNIYSFEQFGEEQKIPLSDAKLIIRVNKKFAQNGMFFIQSEELVRSSGLQTAYKKILDKENMEELFFQDVKIFQKNFEAMTQLQQNIIANILLLKMIKNESVDMNIVGEVNKILERDLSSEAENTRQVYKQEK